MKTTIKALILATVVSPTVLADTFEWSGNGADQFWGTEANWTRISGDSERTKPDNNDFAVFSQSEDLTVLLHDSSNVQGIRLEPGAGSVTLTLDDGWYNSRQLLVRRSTNSGTWVPIITNFVNLSSNPFTIKSGFIAPLNILFSNAWGDFNMAPGVVFDCPITSANDCSGWLLPQVALRTDYAEMNRTVFKRTATFYNTFNVGANHELWVSGDAASLKIEYGANSSVSQINVDGKLIVDGANAVVECTNLVVGAGGAIGGSGTIHGAIGGTYGAKLLFSEDEVLTFDADADISGLMVDATGCAAGNEYLVAKGTTSLPGVSAAQSAQGWMTKAKNGNVYLVNSMTVIDSDITLDADADWSATPVTVADNVTIDLNGHSLSVAGITFGTGVTFVNNGSEKSRLYAGLSGADKTWLLGLNLAASIMPVFVGAAVEIPQTFVPAGGIGFKNTSGEQYLYNASCNNGLAFLGGGKIIEQWKDWNFGAGKTCTVTVEGDDNTFTFNNDNWSTEPGAFTTTPFVGSGTLTIVSSASGMPAAPVVGAKGLGNSGFSGKIILKPASNYSNDNGYGIKFEDDNNIADGLANGTVSLLWDGEGKAHFSLRSQNGSTPPTYNIGNLVTEGVHPENIVLSAQITPAYAVLKTGWENEDGVFAGTITNFNKETEKPINIEKHGTGTWKLTGTVANGGTFTVAEGGVEFRNGLANATSLTVASGASALFAGDMGANPISFASGSTLKLDASNEGDDVPVVNADLDLTGVSIYVSQGTYVPSKTTPRELLRVTGTLTGFDRSRVETDIEAAGWAFRVVDNGDGTKSLVHKRRAEMRIVLR